MATNKLWLKLNGVKGFAISHVAAIYYKYNSAEGTKNQTLKEYLDEQNKAMQTYMQEQEEINFQKRYGLVNQVTTFQEDGTIVTETEDAIVTTTKQMTLDVEGTEIITERIQHKNGNGVTYVKTTTIEPPDESGNKKITEAYEIEHE